MGPVIIIALVLLVGWFLVTVPSRRRAREHQAMQNELAVGDEIISAGGLHGVVRELGESELKVEIAPGVVATLDRRAVAAVAEEVVEDTDEPADEQIPYDSVPPESS
jgi:preprotein translocase subunit YajC